MNAPKDDMGLSDLTNKVSVEFKNIGALGRSRRRHRSNTAAFSDEENFQGANAWAEFRDRLQGARADNQRILAIHADIQDVELASVHIFLKQNVTPVGDWRYRAEVFPDNFELNPEIHGVVKIQNPIAKWTLRFAIGEAQLKVHRMRLF